MRKAAPFKCGALHMTEMEVGLYPTGNQISTERHIALHVKDRVRPTTLAHDNDQATSLRPTNKLNKVRHYNSLAAKTL